MNKLFLLLCCAVFVSCNNQDAATAKNETTNNTSPAVTSTISEETRFEILAGCVDDVRATAGSSFDSVKTYALCNCMLREMQARYPTADSTAIINYLNDTLQVAQVAPKCQ